MLREALFAKNQPSANGDALPIPTTMGSNHDRPRPARARRDAPSTRRCWSPIRTTRLALRDVRLQGASGGSGGDRVQGGGAAANMTGIVNGWCWSCPFCFPHGRRRLRVHPASACAVHARRTGCPGRWQYRQPGIGGEATRDGARTRVGDRSRRFDVRVRAPARAPEREGESACALGARTRPSSLLPTFLATMATFPKSESPSSLPTRASCSSAVREVRSSPTAPCRTRRAGASPAWRRAPRAGFVSDAIFSCGLVLTTGAACDLACSPSSVRLGAVV
jgi:hypothetical protein